MPYTYDRSPGGDTLSITGCDQHGGIILTAHSGESGVPVCIPTEDVTEVAREMLAWAGLRAAAADLVTVAPERESVNAHWGFKRNA